MSQETDNEVRTRQALEHRERYEQLAVWLGVESLKKLVPFSTDGIRAALAAGDIHLNGLSLSSWDRQHGSPDGKQVDSGMWSVPRVKKTPCPCCGQLREVPVSKDDGVWGVLRVAIARDRQAGVTPLRTSWSLSDTVCVLKHVAQYHIAVEGAQ